MKFLLIYIYKWVEWNYFEMGNISLKRAYKLVFPINKLFKDVIHLYNQFSAPEPYKKRQWAIFDPKLLFRDFSGGVCGKEHTCQCRRHKRSRFDSWV